MRLFGKNPTFERMRSNPQSIKTIYIEDGFNEAGYTYKKAKQHGISVVLFPKSKMDKLGRNINTQGIMADVVEFEYKDYHELLEDALDKKRTLLFLDQINDPQNFGAIIRSAGCLGHFAIIIPTHKSVKVTEAVLRVASGGENHVPIAQVANLRNAMREAKKQGFHIAATVVKEGECLTGVKLPYPLGVLIGSEQKGVREINKQEIDLQITIPMWQERLSFNAAHAATILCYEVIRQQKVRKNKTATV